MRGKGKDARIEGNASAIDPETDRETEQWIKRELRRGNEWAWCVAVVRAIWHGPNGEHWEGADYLGACSYHSEEDFRQPGGYFDDMKDRALDDLNARIAKVAGSIPLEAP